MTSIDGYLDEIRRGVRGMDPRIQQDIVRELQSHLTESVAENGGNVGAAVAGLGEAAAVARRYRDLYGYGPAYRCAPCVERDRLAEDLAVRTREATHWVENRGRVPVRLRGYSLENTTTPLKGETWATFRARCLAAKAIGVTKENAAAVRAMQAWMPMAGSAYLCGPVGTGKSTLVSAVAWKANLHKRYVTYVAEAGLWMKDEQGTYGDVAARRAHILWLDDFGTTESPKDWQREMMETVICQMYAEARPVLFTANTHLGEAKTKWGDRVASRLAEMIGDRVYEITGRDWRQAPR